MSNTLNFKFIVMAKKKKFKTDGLYILHTHTHYIQDIAHYKDVLDGTHYANEIMR